MPKRRKKKLFFNIVFILPIKLHFLFLFQQCYICTDKVHFYLAEIERYYFIKSFVIVDGAK